MMSVSYRATRFASLAANHVRTLYRLGEPTLVRASWADRSDTSARTLERGFLPESGVSVVFTPALVEVRVNQYTSAGLAKGCQPQIFVGR